MQDKQFATQRFARTAGALAIGLAVAGFSAQAQAEDFSKMFSISGFGTLGVTNNSTKNGDYVADVFQPNGAGASQSWAVGVDSKLALQIDGKFTDQLTGVVQIVSRVHPNNTYSPAIEWANLKYAITPDWSVRIGRTAMPVFMNSETRMVGYANPWIRPPIEMYSLRSTTNADGVDMVYRRAIGGATNTTQAWYGSTTVDAVGSTGTISRGVKAEKIIGIADTVEYGAFTVRGAITSVDFRLGAAPSYIYSDSHVYNLGALYDPGTWFVQSELTKTDFGAIQRAQLAMYATAGYRWNKFTPYITVSKVKTDDDQVKLAIRAQTTGSIGLRWDFMKNVDLKVQIDHVALANASNGFFTNVKPAMAGSSAKIISAVVDFVY